MATFKEIWKALTHKGSTGEDRALLYSKLTSFLKETANSDSNGFSSLLCYRHNSLTKCILGDITCASCDQTAIQALGYLLYNPDYAKRFSTDQVHTAIYRLCKVISNISSSRNLCTRALWCLANQHFSSSQMTGHMIIVIQTVTRILVMQTHATPTVDNEAFNLYLRLEEQCPEQFKELASTWYRGLVVRILLTKNITLQKQGLSMAEKYKEVLATSSEGQLWLTATLKQKTVEVMMSQLSRKSLDYPHILNTWAHFVVVLGHVLHRRGSFLNEMLRVVELGFKHQCIAAQVAAYKAWMQLTTNFAQDPNMVSQKCLKLLLMPLLGAAVNERSMQVEVARLRAWWHLIISLGANRHTHFDQVCIPFLMLCVGLNPKMELGRLLSLITENKVIGHAVSPDSDSKPVIISNGATSNGKRVILRNKLLGMLDMPRKGCGQHHIATPTLAMVLTGCSGVLQFIGASESIPESLVESGSEGVVFLGGVVPLNVALFLLVFLDCLASHVTEEMAKESSTNLDRVVYHIAACVITSVEVAHEASPAPSHPLGRERGSRCVEVLIQLLASGCLDLLCDVQTQRDMLSTMACFPRQLLADGNLWKQLLHLLVGLSKGQGQSKWLSSNWMKIVNVVAGAPSSTSDLLSHYLYLSENLPEIAMIGLVSRSALSLMWATMAQHFIDFVTETTGINHGTMLHPDFKAAMQIIKFPFDFLLYQSEKSQVANMLEVWQRLYEVTLLHITLVVRDPSHCPLLTSTELCTSYSHLIHIDTLSSPDLQRCSMNFDLYQNAVATAVSFILSKMKWSKRSDDRSKCIQKLLTLLSWQLKRFSEEASQSTLHLPRLTAPFTFHDIITTFFQNLPTFDLITSAVKMLAVPLAKLWGIVLHGDHTSPSNKPLYDSILSTWSTVTNALQVGGASSLLVPLLPSLSPLLVSTLDAQLEKLASVTLGFWALTFDLQEGLTFSPELVDAFCAYSKTHPIPHELRLVGMGVARRDDTTEERVNSMSDSDVTAVNETQPDDTCMSEPMLEPMLEPRSKVQDESRPDEDVIITHSRSKVQDESRPDDEDVIITHSSPQRGAHSHHRNPGFISRTSTRRPFSLSPDDCEGETGLKCSPCRPFPIPMTTGEKLESVCKKLSLNKDNSLISRVADPPAVTRTRLLTEQPQEQHMVHDDPEQDAPQKLQGTRTNANVAKASVQTPPTMDITRENEGVVPTATTRKSNHSKSTPSPSPEVTPNTGVLETSYLPDEDTPTFECHMSYSETPVEATPITTDATPPPEPLLLCKETTSASETIAGKNTPEIETTPTTCDTSNVGTVVPVLTDLPEVASLPATPSPIDVTPTFEAAVPLLAITPDAESPAETMPFMTSRAETVLTNTTPTPLASVNGRGLPVASPTNHIAAATTAPAKPPTTPVTLASMQPNIRQAMTATPPTLNTTTLSSPPSTVQPHTRRLLIQALLSKRNCTMPVLNSEQGTEGVIDVSVLQANNVSALLASTSSASTFSSCVSTASRAPILLCSSPPVDTSSSSGNVRVRGPGPMCISSSCAPRFSTGLSSNSSRSIDSGKKNAHISATCGAAVANQKDAAGRVGSTDQNKAPGSNTLPPESSVVPPAVRRKRFRRSSRKSLDNLGDVGPPKAKKGRKSGEADPMTPKTKASTGVGKQSGQKEGQRQDISRDGPPRPTVPGTNVRAGRRSKKPISEPLQSHSHSSTTTASVIKKLLAKPALSDGCRTSSESRKKSTPEPILPPGDVVGTSSGSDAMVDLDTLQDHFDESEAMDTTNIQVGGKVCDTEDPLKELNECGQKGSTPLAEEQMPSSSEVKSSEVKSSGLVLDKTMTSCDVSPGPRDDASTVQVGVDVSPGPRDDASTVQVGVDVSPGPRDDASTVQVGVDVSPGPRDDASTVQVGGDVSPGPRDDASTVQVGVTPGHHTPQGDVATLQKGGSSTGILKHVSQFDTPCSARQEGGCRVKFACHDDHKETAGKEQKLTPKQGRSCVGVPQDLFSSRRTLHMTLPISSKPSTNTKVAPASPVFPSLVGCLAPVEQILPSLSPAGKFTHGLVQLVRARNIATVGEISSLTTKQVQTLPIKSPKVVTLRKALIAFKRQQKAKSRTSDGESLPSSARTHVGTAPTSVPTSIPTAAISREQGEVQPVPTDKTEVTVMETSEATPTCMEDSFMMESDPDAVVTCASLEMLLDDQAQRVESDPDAVMTTCVTLEMSEGLDDTTVPNKVCLENPTHSTETTPSALVTDAKLNPEGAVIENDEMGPNDVGGVHVQDMIDQSQELFSPEMIGSVGVPSDVGVSSDVDMASSSVEADTRELDEPECIPDGKESEPVHQNLEPNLPSPPSEKTTNQISDAIAPDTVSSVENVCVHDDDHTLVSTSDGEGGPSDDARALAEPSVHDSGITQPPAPSPALEEELLCLLDKVHNKLKDPTLLLNRQKLCELMEKLTGASASVCSRLRTLV